MRITRRIFEEVERLLNEKKWSQRRIAREVGISRSTVNNISHGYQPRREELPDDLEPTGPLVRCPGCGGRVHLPCVLCHVREIKDQERRLRNPRAFAVRERRDP